MMANLDVLLSQQIHTAGDCLSNSHYFGYVFIICQVAQLFWGIEWLVVSTFWRQGVINSISQFFRGIKWSVVPIKLLEITNDR